MSCGVSRTNFHLQTNDATYIASVRDDYTKRLNYEETIFPDNTTSSNNPEQAPKRTTSSSSSNADSSYIVGTTRRGMQITDAAREYLNEGYYEYTQAEIDQMKRQHQDISHTQHTFLEPFLGVGTGNNKVTEDSSWCAAFVNRIAHDTGILNEHQNFCGVQQFIDWGTKNGRYRPIEQNTTSQQTLEADRATRREQIKKQLPEMRSGDFIIWKSGNFQVKTNQGIKNQHSSHIGIIESVDRKNGTVTVIEGNANTNITGQHERYVVQNENQGKNGNQSVGEMQEVNPRDGLIRKTYTIEDLANFGYSGYISNGK